MDNNYIAKISIANFKNRKVDKETFLGVFVSIVMNKEIFNTNNDAGFFINDTLNILLPHYVMRSRTLMVARACRILFIADENKIESYVKKTFIYLSYLQKETNTENPSTNQKAKIRSKSISNMNKWINGILKKED